MRVCRWQATAPLEVSVAWHRGCAETPLQPRFGPWRLFQHRECRRKRWDPPGPLSQLFPRLSERKRCRLDDVDCGSGGRDRRSLSVPVWFLPLSIDSRSCSPCSRVPGGKRMCTSANFAYARLSPRWTGTPGTDRHDRHFRRLELGTDREHCGNRVGTI